MIHRQNNKKMIKFKIKLRKKAYKLFRKQPNKMYLMKILMKKQKNNIQIIVLIVLIINKIYINKRVYKFNKEIYFIIKMSKFRKMKL